MKGILEKLDSKLITSAGGIVLALFLAYVLYMTLTNDLTHINSSIEKQTVVQEKTNDVLRELSTTVAGNTSVIRSLEATVLRGYTAR